MSRRKELAIILEEIEDMKTHTHRLDKQKMLRHMMRIANAVKKFKKSGEWGLITGIEGLLINKYSRDITNPAYSLGRIDGVRGIRESLEEFISEIEIYNQGKTRNSYTTKEKCVIDSGYCA